MDAERSGVASVCDFRHVRVFVASRVFFSVLLALVTMLVVQSLIRGAYGGVVPCGQGFRDFSI